MSNEKKKKEKKKINTNKNISSSVVDSKKPIIKTKTSTISDKIEIKVKKKGWWNKD